MRRQRRRGRAGTYSIWRAAKENAAGWRDEGTRGGKDACLAHIQEVGIDLRPRSLRERMSR
ncbi:MbtH family NRPS accessory protein [Actinokineospora sp.]|uniref:MbtH family NRPS accessory protein n=1 Tax=Actinokineospora sp. TaxID=1872133 RepID=UPI003D6A2F3E